MLIKYSSNMNILIIFILLSISCTVDTFSCPPASVVQQLVNGNYPYNNPSCSGPSHPRTPFQSSNSCSQPAIASPQPSYPNSGAPAGNDVSCGGSTSNFEACGDYWGNCWCDDACYTYGDCCYDYLQKCKIPSIQSISPPNGPSSGGILITLNGGSFSSQGTLVWYNQYTNAQYTYFFTCSSSNLRNNAGQNTYQSEFGVYVNCATGSGVTLPNGATTGYNNGNVNVAGVNKPAIESWSDQAIIMYLPAGVGLGWKINITNSYNTNGVSLSTTCPSTSAFNNNTQPINPTFNYDPPLIKSALAASAQVPISIPTGATSYSTTTQSISNWIPTQGGTQITLYGVSFGVSATGGSTLQTPTAVYFNGIVVATAYGTGSSAATILSDGIATTSNTMPSAISFTLPAGENPSSNNNLTLLVGGQISNAYFLLYSAPILYTNFSCTTDPTSGNATVTAGSSITIWGQSFGASTPGSSHSGILSIGSQATITKQTDTMIIATVPPGQGKSVSVIYSQGGLYGATYNQLQFTVNYAAPFVQSISPRTGNTAGGYQMTITGYNFGPSISPSQLPGPVTVGGNACTPINYALSSSVQIVCTVPTGEGSNQAVVVYVGGQAYPPIGSSTVIGFSYNIPVVNTIVPANGPTTGNTVVTISGSNFGYLGDVQVLIGGIPVTAQLVSAALGTINATIPAGQGAGLQVVVRVAGLTSTNAVTYSYDKPVIYTITSTSQPCLGNVPVTITGINFGLSGNGQVTIGGSTCATLTWSHTVITCTLPAGTGRQQPVVVVVPVSTAGVTAQSSGNGNTFNYSAPSITGLYPVVGPTSGNVPITLSGVNFGSVTSTGPPGTVSATNGVTTINSVTITSWTDGSIVFSLPVADGTNWRYTVITSSQSSSQSSIFTYNAPTLSSINPSIGATRGGTYITLTGLSFDTSGTIYVNNVAVPSIGVQWGQSTVIFPLPAGQGANIPIKLTTVAGKSSTVTSSTVVSYYTPTISSISPSTVATLNGGLLTITGTNFGTSGNQNVTIGGTLTCSNPVYSQVASPSTSDMIKCTIPQGQGTGLSVVVTTGGQSSNPQFLSYSNPSISSVSPLNGPTAGNIHLTIVGTSFGTHGGSVTIGANSAACNITSQTDTTVICTLPPGDGQSQNLIMTVTTGQSVQYSNIQLFNYDPPTVTSFQSPSGTTSGFSTLGGQYITIYGTNFGPNAPTVNIGSGACTPVISHTDSSVICTVPAGQGSNLDIAVSASGQSALLSTYTRNLFTYNSPTVTAVAYTSNVTAGGQLITLTGSNFGTTGSSASATITIGGATCSNVAVSSIGSTYTATCTAPAYSGSTLPVQIRVSGLSSNTSTSPTFTYAAPSITAISPTTGNTLGGVVLTINGTNFGPSTVSGAVLVGGQICTSINGGWSDTQIQCTLPQGQGLLNNVILTPPPVIADVGLTVVNTGAE